MRRVGIASVVMLLALFALFGCNKETGSEAKVTGIELHFDSCLTFSAWVWIDDNYQGTFTDEQPTVIEMSAGQHVLYARSNIFVDQSSDTIFCWTQDFNVASNELLPVRLNCHGHRCEAAGGGAQ